MQPFEQRLSELKVEFDSGQKVMAELETKRANLRDTLLRISGAIQVLEELGGSESRPQADGMKQLDNLQLSPAQLGANGNGESSHSR